MESLALRYRPKCFDDLSEQQEIRVILENQIKTNTIKHGYLFTGPAGCGKAQPLYSKVLTPNGYVNMGDVYIGQEVITSKGNLAHITDIYPQGKRPIYEITLQDNTKIRVADNHLNVVEWYNQDKKQIEEFVLTTTELIEKMKTARFKLRMGLPKVTWEFTDIPIAPYLLGALIGDGSLSNNMSFCNAEHDVLAKVSKMLRPWDLELKRIENTHDYRISYSKGHMANQFTEKTLKKELEKLNLMCKSVDKHIPTEYLLNTYEVRLALLQGLIDTDGYIAKGGAVYFNTSSKQLSEDFAFLVRSLGIRDTITISDSGYKDSDGNYVKCNSSYNHYLKIPNGMKFYTSEKHKNRYKNRQNEPIRNITSIEYIGDEECQCIMLDHEDHTYISDDFIPTHNTTSARIFANMINNGSGEPIELDAASNNGVDDIRKLIEDAQTKSLDSEYKVFIIDECHMITTQGFNAFLKTLEEPPAKSIFILCTTNPEKVPATILSRVQRYNFQKISTKGIYDRLLYISATENIHITNEALQLLSKLAQGGMRDGITLLDKVISYGADEITVDIVLEALGVADYQTMLNLNQSIFDKNKQDIIKIIDDVYNKGLDLKQFVRNYFEFMLEVNVYDIVRDSNIITLPANVIAELNTYGSYEYTTCTKLLKFLVDLMNKIQYEHNPKSVIIASFILFEVE